MCEHKAQTTHLFSVSKRRKSWRSQAESRYLQNIFLFELLFFNKKDQLKNQTEKLERKLVGNWTPLITD